MDNITIVDARMGRGKTSAAINYMLDNLESKRFLYVTPYLTEVDRVCKACDFEQPDSDHMSKLAELKNMFGKKENIVSTHSLFGLMDDEALALISDNHYSLIIDEGIEVVSNVNVTAKDKNLITTKLGTVDDEGKVSWIDKDYSGKFSSYKEMADVGTLYTMDNALIRVMRPEMLKAFDEVIMMTYLFRGQYQRAYLDYYGFNYSIVGINNDGQLKFSNLPDNPAPMDYSSLIHIVEDERMNRVGQDKYALSKNWFSSRRYNDPAIKELRRNFGSFFRNNATCDGNRLWTCFKTEIDKFMDSKSRYKNSFLQMSAKATNAYKDKIYVEYLVNRFLDPNIVKFFNSRGAYIDPDEFALSEMLQFIWRSAIREGNPIYVYIPSRRMRDLLKKWIDDNSKID